MFVVDIPFISIQAARHESIYKLLEYGANVIFQNSYSGVAINAFRMAQSHLLQPKSTYSHYYIQTFQLAFGHFWGLPDSKDEEEHFVFIDGHFSSKIWGGVQFKN